MQIRRLTVRNFRGIAFLNWDPGAAFCCLIGSGDSGKSTILDAAEAALNSRWVSFSEADFLACDTANTIAIEATVGELSDALKSDDRFGFCIRGWTPEQTLRDEPEDGDEPVVTLRLTVDVTLEPVWEIVCDRMEKPRIVSSRDRALFGVVRLAGSDSRHLAWGQGSVLSRLTGDKNEAADRLAEAYKAARDSAELGKVKALADAATAAEQHAKAMGAYVDGAYLPGLEIGRSGPSAGSIALHDGGVPLRLAGLGTRRLATLGIQQSAVAEGAIILVDEIEHGLEPHRIIGAISKLKGDQEAANIVGNPIGQVLLTTHSEIAICEAGEASLRVVSTSRPGREGTARASKDPDALNAILRFSPRAMFARRILVCEGYTEVGLTSGMSWEWRPRHRGVAIEQLGSAIVDGNGAQAGALALSLADLGFAVGLFRDSDKELHPAEKAALRKAGVPIFEYEGCLDTEQALFFAASDDAVEDLLNHARLEGGDDFVNDNLAPKIAGLNRVNAAHDFAGWASAFGKSGRELREIIAEVANRKKWFKDQRVARGISKLAWSIAQANPASPFAKTFEAIERWLYD